MDVLGSLMTSVVGPLLGNAALKTAAMGLAVKWATDQLKVVMAQVDKNGLPAGYKMPVQVMVAIASTLVSLGTLAMQGQLSTFPLEATMNTLLTALQAALAGVGVHHVLKASLVKFTGKDTLSLFKKK